MCMRGRRVLTEGFERWIRLIRSARLLLVRVAGGSSSEDERKTNAGVSPLRNGR
jgi:hypothetical protein